MLPFLEPKRVTSSILGGDSSPPSEEGKLDLKDMALRAIAHEIIKYVHEDDADGLTECLRNLCQLHEYDDDEKALSDQY